jgi:hypothetical protein
MTDHNNLYNILNKLNKLSPQEPAKSAEPKQKNLLESTMEEVLNEKYMGFKKTVGALKKQGGVDNPEALAASIGRKKYGKEAFQKAAAAGKKMGEAEMEEGNEFSGNRQDAINAGQDEFEVDGKRYPVKENGLQRYTGIKKYGKDGFEALQKAGREGADEEEKGRIKDRYIKKEDAHDPFANVDPKVEKPTIHGTDKKAKTGYYPAKQTVKKLDKPTKKYDDIDGSTSLLYRENEGEKPHPKELEMIGKTREMGVQNRARDAEQRMANRAAQPKNFMQKVKQDIGGPLSKLAKGDVAGALGEGFPTVADAKKQAEKEKGTGKFDKKSISTGTVYSRKYNAKSGESDETGNDSEGNAQEKRGRGRPKKSAFESHRTINRMVDDVFESIMGEGDETQLSYEQEQLKSHIGAHMYRQLENTLKTGDDFGDNLFDVLYDYYMDEMPYGVAKARTGDPTQWLQDKVQAIFPALDEGRIEGGVFVDKPGKVPAPMDPEGVPTPRVTKTFPTVKPAPAPTAPSSAPMGTIKGGVWNADAPKAGEKGVPAPVPVDEADMEEGNLFTKGLADDDIKVGEKIPGTNAVKTKDIDEALNQMRRIAGLPVVESKADEKADNDYDNDGKVETGKEEYLGSKIAAAKKAGRLKESTCKACHEDPCVCKEEKCMECGMYESKCSCDTAKKVDECMTMSPMGNGMGQEEQAGKMNINTSMDSDGHKSVTITADGNSALELMQMLKLAGMGGGDLPQQEPVEPEGVMVVTTGDDEAMDEDMIASPKEVDEDSRYEANTTPEEHVYGTQKLTKGGDGDFGEKRMHGDRPTWKNGDNPLGENRSLKMMREYEAIKIKK